AKLKTEGTVIIRNGYVLGGDGTVEGDLYIENGGRLETSISLFSNGSFSESILLYGGATLEYVEGSPLALLGSGSFYLETLTGVLIDFSNVSLTVDSDYVIIDWTGSELSPYGHDVADFSVAGTDVEGNFRIENNQLIFNATAVPEPSTWFLLGAGLGALALLRRRRE
ncbi:MAG: PEP-CTERM sorting domain-containing protein, partial [Verrucomicrobiales bacterium]|nr:PEP-CTERM sorting domain-containing protein [Verrucomicrobiales bacterium]